jgi:uncharacterized membrane protein YbaN (DUF454 family)
MTHAHAHAHPPTPARRSRARNLALGIGFFILGVIGVLIPVMPQVPFFIMSALFFSLVFPKVRRAIRRFRHGHPKLDRAYRNWRGKARRKRQVKIRKRRPD